MKTEMMMSRRKICPRQDTMVELMDLMSQEGLSDNTLRKILDYVERVVSEVD